MSVDSMLDELKGMTIEARLEFFARAINALEPDSFPWRAGRVDIALNSITSLSDEYQRELLDTIAQTEFRRADGEPMGELNWLGELIVGARRNMASDTNDGVADAGDQEPSDIAFNNIINFSDEQQWALIERIGEVETKDETSLPLALLHDAVVAFGLAELLSSSGRIDVAVWAYQALPDADSRTEVNTQINDYLDVLGELNQPTTDDHDEVRDWLDKVDEQAAPAPVQQSAPPDPVEQIFSELINLPDSAQWELFNRISRTDFFRADETTPLDTMNWLREAIKAYREAQKSKEPPHSEIMYTLTAWGAVRLSFSYAPQLFMEFYEAVRKIGNFTDDLGVFSIPVFQSRDYKTGIMDYVKTPPGIHYSGSDVDTRQYEIRHIYKRLFPGEPDSLPEADRDQLAKAQALFYTMVCERMHHFLDTTFLAVIRLCAKGPNITVEDRKNAERVHLPLFEGGYSKGQRPIDNSLLSELYPLADVLIGWWTDASDIRRRQGVRGKQEIRDLFSTRWKERMGIHQQNFMATVERFLAVFYDPKKKSGDKTPKVIAKRHAYFWMFGEDVGTTKAKEKYDESKNLRKPSPIKSDLIQ